MRVAAGLTLGSGHQRLNEHAAALLLVSPPGERFLYHALRGHGRQTAIRLCLWRGPIRSLHGLPFLGTQRSPSAVSKPDESRSGPVSGDSRRFSIHVAAMTLDSASRTLAAGQAWLAPHSNRRTTT
jgi:hypothetical protein